MVFKRGGPQPRVYLHENTKGKDSPPQKKKKKKKEESLNREVVSHTGDPSLRVLPPCFSLCTYYLYELIQVTHCKVIQAQTSDIMIC